ncbi:MAG: FAD-dependent oxidoreductase [Patescibacteria group bacterium]|nr:FAD-dependent oxidoreductase [Patescibacteria group bacterium]
MAFKNLFEPIMIGSLKLKNRLVLPPMVRNWATERGEVTDRLVDHYAALARGGTAMLILEAIYVSPEGRGFTYQMGIDNDALVPGLKKLVDAAHQYGAAIGPQLYHAGRQTNSKTISQPPVAPSPIPCPVQREMPRELSAEEISEIENAFAAAALRAKGAGFDFVEVHGAHGYLITQFLSAYSNKRKDAYGGDLEGRMAFLKNIIKKIRAAVGPDYPVTVRLSGEERVPGGLTIDDTKKIVKELEKLGIDAVHISVGNYGSFAEGLMIPTMAAPTGALVYLAEQVKKSTRLPVIAVGKINTPELAEEIIANGQADMVALGRELMADPEWPNKVRDGRADEIQRCIACNQGCIDRLFAGLDTQCVVNPLFGREREFAVTPAADLKKIMVIGGGPAGMQAAIVAKKRGHGVAIYEQGSELGGALLFAQKPPHREGIAWLVKDFIAQIHELGIEENFNTEVTPELVAEVKPDAIIIATGSECALPPIPGVNLPNVMSPRDVLSGQVRVGNSVIVAGGGCVGAEVAEYLVERGHKVKIVEMREAIVSDLGFADGVQLRARLEKLGVEIFTKTKILEIKKDGIVIEREGLPARLAEAVAKRAGRQGKRDEIGGESLVLCLGSKSVNDLEKLLVGAASEIVVVGDAVEPRRILEAVYEGYAAGLNI